MVTVLAGCGKSIDVRYASKVERGRILIELQDGQKLYVMDFHPEQNRIWVLFPGQRVSWIPEEQVKMIPSAPHRKTGFLEAYLNSPNSYEQSDWLSLEPWELVEALRVEEVQSRIGYYDLSSPSKKPSTIGEGDMKGIHFNDLRYYPEKRTRNALLKVLEQDVSNTLSKEKKN
jgi:hypothetical protein